MAPTPPTTVDPPKDDPTPTPTVPDGYDLDEGDPKPPLEDQPKPTVEDALKDDPVNDEEVTDFE